MAVGPLNQSSTTALYKEKYRDVVPALWEAEINVCTMMNTKTDVERIGPRGIRVPKKMKPGGQVRTFSPDGGDLGRGTGAQYEYSTVTPLPLLVALEATRAAQWYTGSDDIAVKNAVKDQLKDGTSEFKRQLDRYLMGDGTGVMGTISSGQGTTALVMTTPIGTRWLLPGHRYQVYDTTLATNRGIIVVDNVDAPNRTANMTTIGPAGLINGDKLLPDGVDGANPAWYHGFRYQFSSSATGTWDGMARASFPQIRSVEVVAGGALVQVHIRGLKQRMRLNRDRCFDKGRWNVVWNPATEQAYEELGFGVNQYPKNQPSRTGLDVMYDPNQFSVDGMAPLTTSNQNPTVIDLTNWDNWYRVETIPFGLYTVDEVSTFPVYGASGGLSATDITYLAAIFGFGVDDPGLGGYISSVTVPAGYSEFGT